jgi:feruloyl esterase
MSNLPRLARALGTAIVLAVGGVPAAHAADCADLANLKIDESNLLSAAAVPAKAPLPEYCRVLGYVRPAVNFEIRLPTKDWNGKFLMAGCGGFCGTLDSDNMTLTNGSNVGLMRNYATVSMDSGHWGASLADGRWAYNNLVAKFDWGQRAVTMTARVTKAVIESYYGKPPSKSYFNGCSTGGRMAHMEAWKYPEDFDGIISGAPAVDYTGLVATFFAWVTQANTGSDGKPILAQPKVKLVEAAVNKACADQDGVVQDPRKCSFKPATLKCQADGGGDCLSAAEVAVLEKWYGGAKNSKGEQLYPGGVPLGSEAYWPLWLTGLPTGQGPLIPAFGNDFVRYMAFEPDPGPSYDLLKFDFDADPARLKTMAEIYNSTNPDLSKFKARGGKMLMYQGWADAIVTPAMTVDYYEAVENKSGGREATQSYLRLFMLPGVDHCGIQPGPGADRRGFDPLTALEQWVERGVPPATLVTTKRDKDGKAVWTRPVCPYPQIASFRGSGDREDPAGYACAEP